MRIEGFMTNDQTNLHHQLTNLAPQTPEEEVARRAMLDLLKDPSCFERRCTKPGHFTASALVISADNQRVLLLHHRKLNLWLQPGGHADGDQNLEFVAKKEVQEETGLTDLEVVPDSLGNRVFDLDIHEIPARKSDPVHQHFDVRFLLRCRPGSEELTPNHESNDIRWFQRDRLPTQEASILRMVDKLAAQEAP